MAQTTFDGRQRDFSRSMTRASMPPSAADADEDVLGKKAVVLDAVGVHVAQQRGDRFKHPQPHGARRRALLQPALHAVLHRDEAAQFLGDQDGALVLADLVHGEVHRLQRRDAAGAVVLDVAELAQEGRRAAHRVGPQTRLVVLLALEEDGARAAAGQGQFAARDAAPAAAAMVGFLEPVRLQMPQGVEVGQAVVGEDRPPALVDEVLHRRLIFSRAARRRATCPST
jgi:hypothetical protein